jgi:hypothetical protein
LWRIGILLDLNLFAATIPAIFLILTPDFIGTVTNGLETPLFMVILLEIIYSFLRGKYLLSFLFLGLLFITRVETIGIGFFFIILTLIINIKGKVRSVASGILIYIGIITAITIFRFLYYQDVVPNSVRVKSVSLTPSIILNGVRYILDFTVENPVYFIIITASILLLIVELYKPNFFEAMNKIFTNKSNQLLLISTACILFSFIVIMRNGGDWMPNFRLLFLYGALYASLIIPLLKKSTISVIFVAAFLFGPLIHVSDLTLNRIRNEPEFNLVEYSPGMTFWGDTASRLSPVLSASDTVSAEAIGYIAYHLPDTSIHDPLGLTDRHIAKNGIPAVPYGKTDIEYTVHTIRPSVMIWQFSGHLDDLDLTALDKQYKTYCYEFCDSWAADIVMIRSDRVQDLSINFQDWTVITLKSLQ